MSAPTSTRTRIGFLHATAPKQSTVATRLFAAARHETLDSQRDQVELPLVKTLLCRITTPTHTPIPPLNCMQITAVQHTSTVMQVAFAPHKPGTREWGLLLPVEAMLRHFRRLLNYRIAYRQ